MESFFFFSWDLFANWLLVLLIGFFFFVLLTIWAVLSNRFKSVGLFADLVPVFMVPLVTETQVSAYHLMNESKIYGGN